MKDKVYTTQEVSPKNLPIKCPVCNGFGTLRHGTLTCHGCEGKGFVLVEAKENNSNFEKGRSSFTSEKT